MTVTETTVTLIPIGQLQPAENKLRGKLADITQLARSITGVGILEPLLVTPVTGDADRYTIVAGHRRHAGAVRAGLEVLPCIVRVMSDAERIEVMLVENLQRSDGIPVLAEAAGYFRLVSAHGYTVRRLAQQVGRSEGHVRTRLALLELPDAAQEALESDDISVAQAERLLAAKHRPDLIEALLAEPDWNRRDMERAVADALRRADHEAQRMVLVADLGPDESDHQAEVCHAVVVEMGYAGPAIVAVCTDRQRHSSKASPSDRSHLQVEDQGADAERARAKTRRRQAERRRDFAATRLAARLPKAPTMAFIVGALLDRANSNDASRAGALLGLSALVGRYGDDWHGALADVTEQSDVDRVRVGAALAVVMAEARITSGAETAGSPTYVAFLDALGYEPEPDERPPEHPGSTAAASSD